MPFVSSKQRKYLFSQKPSVAKKFVADGIGKGKNKLKGLKKLKKPVYMGG